MTRSIARGALVGGTVAVLAAAPAAAAPDRAVTFGDSGQAQSWQSAVGSGAALTSELAAAFPCDTPLQTCDDTLVTTGERGRLTITAVGDQPTLVDLDLHVFKATPAGEPVGEPIASVTDFDADEQATVQRQPAGTYLIRVNWSSGVGSYSGRVTYLPQPLPPA